MQRQEFNSNLSIGEFRIQTEKNKNMFIIIVRLELEKNYLPNWPISSLAISYTGSFPVSYLCVDRNIDFPKGWIWTRQHGFQHQSPSLLIDKGEKKSVYWQSQKIRNGVYSPSSWTNWNCQRDKVTMCSTLSFGTFLESGGNLTLKRTLGDKDLLYISECNITFLWYR